MHTICKNLGYAGRRLRQNPGFACTAVLSLALGIGANIAIFSLVNAVLIQNPPIKAPEEIVNVYISDTGDSYGTFSYPDFRDLRDESKDAFTSLSASGLTVAQADRDGERAALIRELKAAGHSLNEIQRQVFGYVGGAAYDGVRAVLG